MMHGLLRSLGHQRAPKEPPPGKRQAGYLWGTGGQVDIVGDPESWHWRASEGAVIANWSLWYGNREIGLTTYPTNETRDWPDLLFQMVLGLKGIADCPLSDDDLDEIRQNAKEAAEGMRGFPSKDMSRLCPHLKGSIEADIWHYTFNNTYASIHGSDFLRKRSSRR